jgi:hypothetical protein
MSHRIYSNSVNLLLFLESPTKKEDHDHWSGKKAVTERKKGKKTKRQAQGCNSASPSARCLQQSIGHNRVGNANEREPMIGENEIKSAQHGREVPTKADLFSEKGTKKGT